MIDHRFPEQDEPLYCYRAIEKPDKYEIVRYTINAYKQSTKSLCHPAYIFSAKDVGEPYHNESIKEEQMDRFLHKKVYTFDGSWEHICEVVDRDLLKSRQDTLEKLARIDEHIEKWKVTKEVYDGNNFE